ncbi:hypothetical protein [Arsenophonus sp. PmNCSU2021_1]|uniref:hypothetical protein n=1 Tax=Arsenophonus sp. PmNCSU2021_1 TaxID=3118989 RepID=UPI002FF37BE0
MKNQNNIIVSESIKIQTITPVPADWWAQFSEWHSKWDTYFYPVMAMANCFDDKDGNNHLFPIINRGGFYEFTVSKNTPVFFMPKAKVTRRHNSEKNEDGFYVTYE